MLTSDSGLRRSSVVVALVDREGLAVGAAELAPTVDCSNDATRRPLGNCAAFT